MQIRKTTEKDIQSVMQIFAKAREIMRKSGNFKQWPVGYPSEESVIADIKKNNSYVVEKENGNIVATFAFIIGPDPTYSYIEGGQWLNDEPYGTIHRIASNGENKGIMSLVLDYCSKFVSNIRIDTHEDNSIMRHLLAQNGFKHCGTIYLLDGNPRLAFQKVVCE